DQRPSLETRREFGMAALGAHDDRCAIAARLHPAPDHGLAEFFAAAEPAAVEARRVDEVSAAFDIAVQKIERVGLGCAAAEFGAAEADCAHVEIGALQTSITHDSLTRK